MRENVNDKLFWVWEEVSMKCCSRHSFPEKHVQAGTVGKTCSDLPTVKCTLRCLLLFSSVARSITAILNLSFRHSTVPPQASLIFYS